MDKVLLELKPCCKAKTVFLYSILGLLAFFSSFYNFIILKNMYIEINHQYPVPVSVTTPKSKEHSPKNAIKHSQLPHLSEDNDNLPLSNLKKILFYNDVYKNWDFGIGATGHEAFNKLGCPKERCYATPNRTFVPIDKFDAIVFHPRASSFRLNDLPKWRSPHQRYVYWVMESSCYPSKYLS